MSENEPRFGYLRKYVIFHVSMSSFIPIDDRASLNAMCAMPISLMEMFASNGIRALLQRISRAYACMAWMRRAETRGRETRNEKKMDAKQRSHIRSSVPKIGRMIGQ